MKNFLLTAALLIVAFVATAQSGSTYYHRWQDTNDTLGANSTFTYDFNALVFGGQEVSRVWSYSVTVEADSLSGAAADSSTVFLQVSNAAYSDANPVWTTIETDEIDGTATQVFHYTGDLLEPRIRLLIYSKSGTKAIALRSYATFKERYRTK